MNFETGWFIFVCWFMSLLFAFTVGGFVGRRIGKEDAEEERKQ
jgi:CDP-diglyceride synthetase